MNGVCPPSLRAFTLIEAIATIIVLAVLSAVAAPRFFNHSDRAKESAAKYARGSLATSLHSARNSTITSGGTPAWPANLDAILGTQEGNRLLNPYIAAGQAVYDMDSNNDPNKWHPINKTIEAGVANGWGAIWYNAANGGLRFRVPQQANDAATISLYNRVNGTRITSLAQTTP